MAGQEGTRISKSSGFLKSLLAQAGQDLRFPLPCCPVALGHSTPCTNPHVRQRLWSDHPPEEAKKGSWEAALPVSSLRKPEEGGAPGKGADQAQGQSPKGKKVIGTRVLPSSTLIIILASLALLLCMLALQCLPTLPNHSCSSEPTPELQKPLGNQGAPPAR